MKILILGSNGMLGHVVTTFFQEKGYDVIITSRDEKTDNYYDAFKNVYAVENIIKKHKPDVVINCIGILNSDAEAHHALATMLNSFLPNYLDALSLKYSFRFIHITTDCVFSGEKGDYTEDSISDATSFYGRSKALGEVNNNNTLTLRTSIVGPDINPHGIGLFQWFSQQTGEVSGYNEVYWTGVTTIELAKVMEQGIKNQVVGLNHVVNNQKISKYELLELFEKYFKFDLTLKKDNSYKSDKSLIRTDQSYDFNIPDYDTMIKQMYEWVMNHQAIYQNLIERMNQK